MGKNRLAVPAFILAAFVTAPVGVLFWAALEDGQGGLTLERLGLLALSSRQLGLLWTSLLAAGGAALASTAVGVTMAFLLHRTDVWGRDVLRNVYPASLLLPPFVQAAVWTRCIHPGDWAPWLDVYSVPGAIWVFTLSFYPVAALISAAGFRSQDPSLEEAARLGRGAWTAVRKVTLPLALPHITCGAILVFVFSIVNFEAADILRLKVYPLEIFIHFSAYYDEKAATVLSLPLIAAALCLVWAQARYMRGKSYVNLGVEAGVHPVHRLGVWRKPLALIPLFWVGASLVVPSAALARGAGGWSHYVQAWSGGADAAWCSLWVGLTAAAATALAAFPAAYYLVRGRGRWRPLADYALQIPLSVPSIVLGIGFITLWNRPLLDHLYGTVLTLILAMVALAAPFAVKVTAAGIARMDEDLEDAARMGAGAFKTFVRIALPLAFPSVLAGFAVTFVLSLSNLGTSLLVIPPGRDTLPIVIYNYMHYGADEIVCALSLFLLALTAVPVLIIILVYKWSRRRAHT